VNHFIERSNKETWKTNKNNTFQFSTGERIKLNPQKIADTMIVIKSEE